MDGPIPRSAAELFFGMLDIASNPKNTKYIAPALLLMDAVLCGLILRTVAYTEIDWVAYMEQVQQFVQGERDYEMIKGSTGPLVYPGLHVQIYRALYFMTDRGSNIVLAQVYFVFLYLINLGLAMGCYYNAKAPPYIYPMLVLSKRLHSIYVLRCFNDCFAMTALFAAILLYQKKHWAFGSIALSGGIAIKMNVLLVLPAALVILYQALGPVDMMSQLLRMFYVQLVAGWPFLRANWKGYLTRAYDFRRQFLYEWTVNWRFLSEKTFLSKEFAISLLVVHVSLLAVFVVTRWMQPSGRTYRQMVSLVFAQPPERALELVNARITPEYVLTTMLTANAIGMLCARSLHYQFFSWIAWATPFLLWRTGMHPGLQYFVWLGQELAWNQYPSTDLSSKIVVGVLVVIVFQIWIATDESEPPPKKKTGLPADIGKRTTSRTTIVKNEEATKS